MHVYLVLGVPTTHIYIQKLISTLSLMQAGLLENVATSEFVSLVRLIERFVHSCTDVTGRQCPILRSSLLSQVCPHCCMCTNNPI